MTADVVFVVDPLERLDPALDTSIGLMHAAQRRGARVWATGALALEARDGRARCLATPLHLAPSVPDQGCRWTVPDPWFRAGTPAVLELDEAAAVFVRTEPPLDDRFVTATLVLDLVDPQRTALVNAPAGLRACSEHLLPLHFPDLTPATLVSADPATVRAFVAEHRTVVAKPVDGFAGRGVLRLDHHDPNLASLVETVTGAGTRAAVLQPYLREVTAGNKRVFVVEGEPVGAVHRFPTGGDFRICDTRMAAAPLTDRDREICARLAPTLRRHGVHLAGLDVIGPHLIEVNVTSVGGLRKADALLGWSLCADVVGRALDGSLLAPSLLERTPA
ncbi:glutathione synthase [Pseudonocardia hydrocarbonoxydans]|uniref:Glutathione synthetase n=1 Tax=Pseudonocardia hydrocarbonoxydans TaxID=76726 RepID=A0A4Y3WLB8_9PSEU|nr:glutathione synthase [Pseudonocardia hydrocarbonoxydans]GEC19041.1 glutathione synthetase [Pseudonocardia hydrocarbonoxydans]